MSESSYSSKDMTTALMQVFIMEDHSTFKSVTSEVHARPCSSKKSGDSEVVVRKNSIQRQQISLGRKAIAHMR